MADLKNAKIIYFKGFLFLLSGAIAAGLLVSDSPNLRTVLLLSLAIWCFCRFYYFAFYVIEHYVDSEYRFAGLTSFIRYMLAKRRLPETTRDDSQHQTSAHLNPDERG